MVSWSSVRNSNICPVHLHKSIKMVSLLCRSFTGDDVVELHVHGSRAVILGVFAALEHIHNIKQDTLRIRDNSDEKKANLPVNLFVESYLNNAANKQQLRGSIRPAERGV